MVITTSLLLVLLCAAPATVSPHGPRVSNVRAVSEFAQGVVTEAMRRSPTFATLVATLDTTHVVVYVNVAPFLKTRGSLSFVSYAAGITYVLAQIRPHQSFDDSITTLSHELQHACEVAAAQPAVRSEHEFEQLYRRIGFPADFGARESGDALKIEAAVRRDLRHENGSTEESARVAAIPLDYLQELR